ncbi:hypothetical protein GOP47_0015527 [Adiantum capillus-veneris]|uniref:GDSL esterase/lipase n=1 Tax=Adiantum capillus-veneris TaxID=13818 RepID=A0A9D4UKS2_ADICA|nr:hypothetical protein GOP47_0015527 [Adiantum capillus-veneris]
MGQPLVSVVAAAMMMVLGVGMGMAKGEGEREEWVVERGCKAPLVVFGASMVDVGENAVAQPLTSAAEFPPYGLDYFGRPAARFSNGRVISDFLSQGLGYGLMDPYLNSVDPHFEHGVNFASSGSTARNSTQSGSSARGSGLFPLDMQVKQYKLFKSKLQYLESKNKELKNLPTTTRLSKGIHVIMPAHNDYSNVLVSSSNFDAPSLILSIVAAIEDALREIYKEGARTMIVMNVLPLGCAPAFLSLALLSPPMNLDHDQCVSSYNSIVDLHNSYLKQLIEELRSELSWEGLILFDLNGIYLDVVRHPSKYGVTQPLVACCGAGGNEYNVNLAILCGSSGTVNGTTVQAWRCTYPNNYISWDGLHPTESFAKQIAYAILKGHYTSPHLSIQDACK